MINIRKVGWSTIYLNDMSFLFRKPSYVGLSCAVSGYSNFIRYTSPSRKNSPPQTFRVESGPQVLDNSSMKSLPPVRGQQQVNIKTSSDLVLIFMCDVLAIALLRIENSTSFLPCITPKS